MYGQHQNIYWNTSDHVYCNLMFDSGMQGKPTSTCLLNQFACSNVHLLCQELCWEVSVLSTMPLLSLSQ